MRPEHAPCVATQRIQLPLAVTGCLREDDGPLLGGILTDTKRAWLSRGPILEVIDTSDGSKIATWTFGAVIRDFKTKITCVEEVSRSTSAGLPGPATQLLVGLECELTGGMLCLFNLAGSRVLRAVNIPAKVTALNIVTCNGDSQVPLHPLLQPLSGIVAVGTSAGHIFLMDLRQKDCNEALCSGHLTQWENVHDELRPCTLLALRGLNSFRRLQEHPDDHLCMHLNENAMREHQRLLVTFPGGGCDSFLPENPAVTSILYVPQLASLFVGFSFGSFQIWSLQTLTHVYTLPVDEPNPIVKLAFQEACDDPNAYCYLWAVRGSLGAGGASGSLDEPVPAYGPPAASMYSLSYDEKIWMQDYGYLYKNFVMCSLGFEYDLDGSEGTVGGRLVSLHSFGRDPQNHIQSIAQASAEDSSALGGVCNTTSLCLMVWETWGPAGRGGLHQGVGSSTIHMALFDLNQWYVDHMPSRLSFRGGPSRNKVVAGYIVMYDMDEVFSIGDDLLLDTRINSDSILQFSTVQNVEEHSRPSAISFDSIFLLKRQIVHVQHPGLQRALLSRLVATGPIALIAPTNLFHECLALGLRPLIMDAPVNMNVPIEEQRGLIVCVALEQRLGRFLSRCAREWADGRQSAAGLTLSWFLSVIWNRASSLKQLAVRLSVQLFDNSGEKLDSNSQRQLHHIIGLLHVLHMLFQTVVRNKWHLSLSDWQQVELQCAALELECQYYDVLEWFLGVELLPEGLDSAVPYPAKDIATIYHQRRSEIERLAQQSEEDEVDLLMIDGLIEHQTGGPQVKAEWERDAGGLGCPGAGLYPPASIQALLRTYLVKDVTLDVKNSVVIYLLMDIAAALDSEEHQGAMHRFLQFPSAFHMSAGAIRLTQAFWHLDHKAFDVALDMLLDPLVSARDMEPWQHRSIIRILLVQGQHRMALRYVRARHPPITTFADIRAHLSLLLANDLIHEAFMYQRGHQSEENAQSLLWHFFEGCEKRSQLKTILQFALSEDEEKAFSEFLEKCRHPAADDMRVLYLLKRSRYVEALSVNQELRKKGHSTGTRDIVVNAFYKTLPAVTRSLASHCAQQRSKLESWKQVERPSPLFVEVKKNFNQTRYRSSILDEALLKSRETWTQFVGRSLPTMSGVQSTPFLCTPRTKRKTDLSPRQTSLSCQSPTVCGLYRKRQREEGTDNLASSALKRSRFSHLEGSLSELQQQTQLHQQNSMRNTFSCSDTLHLLHTPVVQRRSPAARARLQQQMLARSPAHSTITPQSIIKVHRNTESASPKSVQRRVFISEPHVSIEPELTEEESESDSNVSPHKPDVSHKKGESETDSEPGEEDAIDTVDRHTARRFIEFGSESSSSESPLPSPVPSPDQSLILPSHSPSPVRPSVSGSLMRQSLSRMVVLSEARKASLQGHSPRKSGHSVTFGRDSVCVFDQDEPVETDAGLHDQSDLENDWQGQESSMESGEPEEVPDEEQNPAYGQDEETNEVATQAKVTEQEMEKPEKIVECVAKDTGQESPVRRSRLETSGFGTMEGLEIEIELTKTDSDIFYSAENSTSGTFCSPTFRRSLARPSIKEISRRHCGKRPQEHSPEEETRKVARLEVAGISTFSRMVGTSSDYEQEKTLSKEVSILPCAKKIPEKPALEVSSVLAGEADSFAHQWEKQNVQYDVESSESDSDVPDRNENSKDSVEVVELDSDASTELQSDTEDEDEYESYTKHSEETDGEEEGFLPENSNVFNLTTSDHDASSLKDFEDLEGNKTMSSDEDAGVAHTDTDCLGTTKDLSETPEASKLGALSSISVPISRGNASLGKANLDVEDFTPTEILSVKNSDLDRAIIVHSCDESSHYGSIRTEDKMSVTDSDVVCLDSDSSQEVDLDTNSRVDLLELEPQSSSDVTSDLDKAVFVGSSLITEDEDDMPKLQIDTSDYDMCMKHAESPTKSQENESQSGIANLPTSSSSVVITWVNEQEMQVDQSESVLEEFSGSVAVGAELVAVDTLPEKPSISNTVPEDDVAVPEDRSASEAVPEDRSASEAVPEDRSASEAVPEDRSASEAVPEDRAASEAVPEDRAASEDVPEDRAASEDVPEDHAASEDVPEDHAASEDVLEHASPEAVPTSDECTVPDALEDRDKAEADQEYSERDSRSLAEEDEVSSLLSDAAVQKRITRQTAVTKQDLLLPVKLPDTPRSLSRRNAQQKQASKEETMGTGPNETVSTTPKTRSRKGSSITEVVHKEGSKSAPRTRSRQGSVSSLHELHEEEIPKRRTRRSSVSSVDGAQEGKEDLISTRSRRRANSGTSVDRDVDKVLQGNLACIAEDENSITQGKSQLTVVNKRRTDSRGGSVVGDSLPDSNASQSPRNAHTRRNPALSESFSEEIRETSIGLPSDSAISEYATTRRLTRHQHALLARSMEISSTEHPVRQRKAHISTAVEDDDLAASSDDDKVSHSSVRSSVRLRLKQERRAAQASPSSTASTIITSSIPDQPATPKRRGRRRLSLSDTSEVQREQSPAVSETRSRRSLQLPSTPTRRSARLSSVATSSAQPSDDGDSHSIASASPSSIASSQRSKRGPARRLSITPERSIENFTFSEPQMTFENNPDTPGDDGVPFTFSPPKNVAPRKSKSSPHSESTSASKKASRTSRSIALQPIEEETFGRMSSDETSPQTRSKSRRSWYFVEPTRSEAEEAELLQQEQQEREQQRRSSAGRKPRVYSVYPTVKAFSLGPVPETGSDDSEDESSSGEEDLEMHKDKVPLVQRTTTRSKKK